MQIRAGKIIDNKAKIARMLGIPKEWNWVVGDSAGKKIVFAFVAPSLDDKHLPLIDISSPPPQIDFIYKDREISRDSAYAALCRVLVHLEKRDDMRDELEDLRIFKKWFDLYSNHAETIEGYKLVEPKKEPDNDIKN